MYFFKIFNVKMLVLGIYFVLVGKNIFFFKFSFDCTSNDWSKENESYDDKQKRLFVNQSCHALSSMLKWIADAISHRISKGIKSLIFFDCSSYTIKVKNQFLLTKNALSVIMIGTKDSYLSKNVFYFFCLLDGRGETVIAASLGKTSTTDRR